MIYAKNTGESTAFLVTMKWTMWKQWNIIDWLSNSKVDADQSYLTDPTLSISTWLGTQRCANVFSASYDNS